LSEDWFALGDNIGNERKGALTLKNTPGTKFVSMEGKRTLKSLSCNKESVICAADLIGRVCAKKPPSRTSPLNLARYTFTAAK
jgi:hypothetical protein